MSPRSDAAELTQPPQADRIAPRIQFESSCDNCIIDTVMMNLLFSDFENIYKFEMRSLFLIATMLLFAKGQVAYQCPILQCNSPISPSSSSSVIPQQEIVFQMINSYKPVTTNFSFTTCFLHPGIDKITNVVSGTIQTYQCPSGSICNLQNGKYAWVNTTA